MDKPKKKRKKVFQDVALVTQEFHLNTYHLKRKYPPTEVSNLE